MLLALHGFTENDECWEPILGGTVAALRCVLLPGHGWKPCPAQTTIASCARTFATEVPDESLDVIGYSMGGRIALQFALDHPQRVRRLILVSCHAGIRSPSDRRNRLARDERLAQILEEDGIGAFVAWWQNNPALAPAGILPRREEERLRSVRLNQNPIGLAGALRCLGAGNMDDLWPRLGRLAMPTLLLSGASDATYCTHHAHMAELMPAARTLAIADAGHAVHREQGSLLAAAVRDFLAEPLAR